jgi:hypothetical protein
VRTTGAAAQPPAPVTEPAVGGSYTDPAFGTTITRLSTATGTHGWVPDSPNVQAWNSSQTLLLLRGTTGSWHLLSGSALTGAPLPLRLPNGNIQPRWSPINPDLLYFVRGNALYRYSVRAARATLVRHYPTLGRTVTIGAHQDLPLGGRYLALLGPATYDHSGEWVKARVAVVDLRTGRPGRPYTLLRPRGAGHENLDWISITPDSADVMVMWAGQGPSLYTRTWRRIRQVAKWDENGAFCRASNGTWWFVETHYLGNFSTDIEANPLTYDVPPRVLWRAPRYNMNADISCGASRLRNWALVSTYWNGIGQHPTTGPALPFDDEVFELGMNSAPSSPTVRRLAQTRTYESDDLYDEPHATQSRDGRLVLFASNLGVDPAVEGYDDTFAIDLRGVR